MVERVLHGKRFLLAFVIATVIFIGVFLAGYLVSYSKYQKISISQEAIRYNLLSLDLEKQLMSESCDIFDPYYFSVDLDNMGSIIGILEERFGKRDQKVMEQKKIYSMLEVQHFLLIKDYNENCKGQIPLILFFYSNEDDFVDSAERMGFILSSLKSKKKEIMIYSFDYNLDSNLIKVLKDRYGVSKPNVVVIDEEVIIADLKNIDDIEKYLK